jgi:hypothetical protein
MTVTAFPSDRGEPRGGPLRGLRTRVPVRGWFTTPNLGAGTFIGSMRVLHLFRRHARPWCQGVVGGTLYDGAGSRLGSASQRCLLPLDVRLDGGRRLSVGPVEADLLGLRVHVDRVMLWSERQDTEMGAVGPRGSESGPAGGASACEGRVVPLVRRAR